MIAERVQPRNEPRLLGFSESGSAILGVAYDLRESRSHRMAKPLRRFSSEWMALRTVRGVRRM
jgi:hypothetical protein